MKRKLHMVSIKKSMGKAIALLMALALALTVMPTTISKAETEEKILNITLPTITSVSLGTKPETPLIGNNLSTFSNNAESDFGYSGGTCTFLLAQNDVMPGNGGKEDSFGDYWGAVVNPYEIGREYGYSISINKSGLTVVPDKICVNGKEYVTLVDGSYYRCMLCLEL